MYRHSFIVPERIIIDALAQALLEKGLALYRHITIMSIA